MEETTRTNEDQTKLNRPDSGPGPSNAEEEEGGRGPDTLQARNDLFPEEDAEAESQTTQSGS